MIQSNNEPAMPRSVTTTTAPTGGTTTWSVPSPFCPHCGGLKPGEIAWIANARPCWCTQKRTPGLNLGNAKIAPDFDALLAAWQCPGCKRWKAPHVTECECEV